MNHSSSVQHFLTVDAAAILDEYNREEFTISLPQLE